MNLRLMSYLFIALLPLQSIAESSLQFLRWKTKSGAQVLFYPAMEVPMLDISVAFDAGSAHDSKDFGVSALTTRLLNQGAAGLNADQIAENLEETGAQYNVENNRDMVVLRLKTLTAPTAMNPALQTLASIISHPDFPLDSFEQQKKQQLMAIAQAQESPDQVANDTFFQALYQTHPYAHPVLGNRATVEPLRIESVRAFYQHYFNSKNAVIVLVGAIDQATAKEIAEKLTRNLPNGEPAPKLPKAIPLSQEMNVIVPFHASQTMLRLGQLGISHDHPDYFPLQVGNYILGGGAMVSELALELREKRGLTYGVYSQFTPMPAIGPFIISLSTKRDQAKTALDLTRETLEKFIKTGPSETELAAAKQYMIGSFPLSLASNRNIADILLKVAFYDLPDNYLETYRDQIKAVTQAQIKQAFQNNIQPNHLLEVSVGSA